MYVYENEEIPEPEMGDWIEDHPIFHQMGIAFGKGKTKKQIELIKRAFYAAVTQIDRQINRIIGTLIEEDMFDNTWIIFTADHGDNLGDHQLWSKSNFLKGSCNIPFIITPPYHGDDRIGDGWADTTNDAVVGLQDILPTLVDIANGTIPDNIDGKSLLPLIKDRTQSVRDVILGEFGAEGRRSLMVTDGNWKYIWYETEGFELLFHLEEDPNELHNLAKKEPEKRIELQNKLIDILSARENDPALDGQELKAKSPGLVLPRRRPKLNPAMAYEAPVGLH